ncbi:aspartate carbamoyltransferase [Thermomicrobium sp. 4228-Ro]|uniref:aspartate carbamoyltransferase n=1 Tax=Thermomicrobium sp. 4228-Ro TaxID=2993937 RepID=UPI0022496311|nr:aspartate carbamoyltransferase [Thermomicrobium sp. 4228-Ro]MCX2727469.1 aspartate carbamoyltransferase [Thermomicrobium sp. 4228-Ro]
MRLETKHVLSVAQFDRRFLLALFDRADEFAALPPREIAPVARGAIMATLFYEPSTRTRLSFEAAMTRLGGSVISAEYAASTSSAAKGESIEDTARVVAGYADLVVIRHPVAGSVARAASVVDIPVINAGDGANEHPTQALIDLYTIWRECGRIDGLTIALVGDLRFGRAARSLARLLTQTVGTKLYLVAPPVTRMDALLVEELRSAGLQVEETGDLEAIAPELDVLYQTRIQRERFSDPEEYAAACGRFVIDERLMQALARHAIVLHPLPRVGEIDPAIDSDPRAAYFRQARNGVPLRMALIEWVLAPHPVGMLSTNGHRHA